MLVELAVRDLGVIEELRLQLGPGLVAVTGETGAGKTMIIEALDLLLGGRADPSRVRPGATEAVVEGLFADGDGECVLRRVVAAQGRSRGYVDGALATAAELAERGAALVEIHGQHAQQSLVTTSSQRAALDRWAGVDTGHWRAAVARRRQLEDERDRLGGDPRLRAREMDLVRYELEELVGAAVDDPAEDDRLRAEEELLGDATELRAAGAAAVSALYADDGALDRIRAVAADLTRRGPYEPTAARLASLAAELEDAIGDVRAVADAVTDDPGRLAEVQQRRRVLADLRRKHGDTLAEVIAARDELGRRLRELSAAEARAAVIDADVAAAAAEEADAAAAVGAARRSAADGLAAALTERLRSVGMEQGVVEVAVGDDPAGESVAFRFAANPGLPAQPLSKVASGGELSRTMLALHLVLSSGPPTMVFDEVDAGIGGVTAGLVGAALSDLAADRQIIVVTHLPQVAAAAGQQVSVVKSSDGSSTRTEAAVLDPDERVIELSRMLSGSPDSAAARRHARELLGAARGAGG